MYNYFFPPKPSCKRATFAEVVLFFGIDSKAAAYADSKISFHSAYYTPELTLLQLMSDDSICYLAKSDNKEALVIYKLANTDTEYQIPLVILKKDSDLKNGFFPKVMPANALDSALNRAPGKCDAEISFEDMKFAKKLSDQVDKYINSFRAPSAGN